MQTQGSLVDLVERAPQGGIRDKRSAGDVVQRPFLMIAVQIRGSRKSAHEPLAPRRWTRTQLRVPLVSFPRFGLDS